MIADGKSPAKEKARNKARVKDAETFGAWAEKWLRGYQMADSTRDMRRLVYERELKPKLSNQKLLEITHEDLRALVDAIVERGAPATAVHVREIVLQVFRWAIERGQKVENPAELVRPTSIEAFWAGTIQTTQSHFLGRLHAQLQARSAKDSTVLVARCDFHGLDVWPDGLAQSRYWRVFR